MANSTRRAEHAATIGLVEAAYDLSVSEDGWFARIVDASLPLLDRGLGAAGIIATKPAAPGPLIFEELHEASGPAGFLARHIEATSRLPAEVVHQQTRSGVWVISELTEDHPEMMRTWASKVEYAKDAISVLALDTDGRGIQILAPAPEVVTLERAERGRWKMLAAHLSAGLRLRRAISNPTADGDDPPFGAEAVLDANNFKVAHAEPGARHRNGLRALREACVRIDGARSRNGKADTTEALENWRALVRGRWSMVDWFDTDQRRYVLAMPNPPGVGNPRGLTERESQVAAFAVLGESHKMIAYRLGISRPRVTHALRSVMRKLSVKTQAQLVAKLSTIRGAVGMEQGTR